MKVHPKFRDHLLETSGEERVGFYERTFFPLSNFSSFAVTWPMEGSEFADEYPVMEGMTSEHIYQAASYPLSEQGIIQAILTARSAHDARKIGLAPENIVKRRAGWRDTKARVMHSICNAKLLQHKYVEICLERTGDALIVEDSDQDSFWGWGPNRDGRNELGKIWMDLRESLRDGTIYPR